MYTYAISSVTTGDSCAASSITQQDGDFYGTDVDTVVSSCNSILSNPLNTLDISDVKIHNLNVCGFTSKLDCPDFISYTRRFDI